MQVRSPMVTSGRATASVHFAAGWLSPVSADSSISRFIATASRPSAGMRSPASTSTTSPGTTSPDGTEITFPSRRMRVFDASIFFNALSDASARCSCTKPIIELSNTTTRTTSGVFNSRDTT